MRFSFSNFYIYYYMDLEIISTIFVWHFGLFTIYSNLIKKVNPKFLKLRGILNI